LPNKKVTFLVVPENSSNVKQVKLSRAVIGLMTCFILCGLAGFTLILHDYYSLKSSAPSRQALMGEVTNQRAQIQTFAEKLRALNSEMMALHDFEKKIRVIANVEAPAGQDAVFGIGGELVRDLEDMPPLTESHSEILRAMHAQLEQLGEASVIQNQAFEGLHNSLQDQKSLLACTPAIRPTTGWMSSGFGYRTSPFTGLREFHRGVDIATRQGTAVIAPADGVVTFTGNKGGLGKMVIIDHGHGKITRYGHLKKWLVRRGGRVERGDKIGLVGNTGRSTAPHLHYEVYLNGIPVNPANYILN
jgi:murein DD-endopeptidase MepM/ murein hydrolase activator NlpD